MEVSFKIDARAMLSLGRDSIKDHTTALLELVKNSYDADATTVEIEIYCNSNENFIRIADNGCGMTDKEVHNYWLRIGYSEKRLHRISKLKRRKTGEKGIGRISADRLGALLTLNTRAKKKEIFGLEINWSDFEVEGKELSDIPIKILDNPDITLPRSKFDNSGTELIIRNPRQKWTKNDIVNLYDELSILTPPFEAVQDFDIYLKTDVAEEYNGKVVSPFYGNAEIALTAKYDSDKKSIYYSIKDRYSLTPKSKAKVEKIEWLNLIQKSAVYDEKIPSQPDFGSVNLTLLFYPRESKILEGTKWRLSDLRDFLNKNAGVKIYRDNIRVKPYGNPEDPEGDWLGIAERKTREPAGVSRPTYKVSANQLVGAVFVGRDDNPKLVDSSGREGLIREDAYNQLRAFVLGCLTLLEAHRHEREIQKKKTVEDRKVSPQKAISQLKQGLDVIKSELKIISKQVPRTHKKSIQRTLDQTLTTTNNLRQAEKSLNELISQARVFRGLATIGIASAVFGHETQSSISEFIAATNTAGNILRKNPKKTNIILEEIEKAIKYADQVSSWGAFALTRIQRDKRRKQRLNIKEIIENTIDEVEPVFKAVDIKIHRKLIFVEGRTFAMDIESILLNLLTNAYTACMQVNRERKINVVLERKEDEGTEGVSVTVADTGPGVDAKLRDKIWTPLFTTKVDADGKQVGTGLGLTIIQSILEDLKGKKNISKDPVLKGARFRIWLPLS